jgi:quinol monooxygenase YgiN
VSSQKKFVVIAEFQIKRGCMEAFLEAARKDASESVAKEPGCRQFDIVLPEAAPDNVVFYETNDDRKAFDAHLETPHLAEFRKAFPPLIEREIPVRFGGKLD